MRFNLLSPWIVSPVGDETVTRKTQNGMYDLVKCGAREFHSNSKGCILTRPWSMSVVCLGFTMQYNPWLVALSAPLGRSLPPRCPFASSHYGRGTALLVAAALSPAHSGVAGPMSTLWNTDKGSSYPAGSHTVTRPCRRLRLHGSSQHPQPHAPYHITRASDPNNPADYSAPTGAPPCGDPQHTNDVSNGGGC